MHQKSVIYVIIGIFQIKTFQCEPYLCNSCHELMQKAMNFNDVAIFFVKEYGYRIYFWYIGKDDATDLI